MNTENTETPPPPASAEAKSQPLAGPINLVSIFEGILKYPDRVIYELQTGRAAATALALGTVLSICLAVYGVVVGSLSGGSQLWIAPAKILLGSALCALICLPSLYIFLCLGGSDTTLRRVGGELLASVALTALLLIGFTPVAWVFSQSTVSVPLMAALDLLFWVIALSFGLRLIGGGENSKLRSKSTVWTIIYILVCLQMMTTLRPIVGTAETFLPQKKEFFLNHAWNLWINGNSTPTN